MSSNGENGASQASVISSTTTRNARSSSQNRNVAESTKVAAASSTQKQPLLSSTGIFSSISSIRSCGGGTASANSTMGGNTSNRSPTSPSRITRLQEKEEMQNLNDRLVIYIDTVRRLESENLRLQNIVHSYNESSTRDVSEIKHLYEKELDDTKKLIDELAKEKARFEIDVNKYRANAAEATTKLDRRTKELKDTETQLKKLESEYAEYRSRSETAHYDLERCQSELTNLRPHATELERQLTKLKKQLEDETLLRVDLENKNTSLKEDLHFKSQIYDKETEQLRSSKRVEIEQVDVRLRDEYDSKLVNELQRIRDEAEAKIIAMKEEVERRYQTKFVDADSAAKRALSQTNNLRDEISSYQLKLQESHTDIHNLQTKLANNDLKIRDLEEKLRQAYIKYDTDMADKDAETEKLRKELHAILTEYQELHDNKIVLDMEINAYRKLIESEEQRLNISNMTASNLHNSYLNDTTMAVGSAANGRGNNKKRRLAQTGEDEQSQAFVDESIAATVTYNQSSESKSGILIGEHDFDANTVVITNPTDKDIPIGHWVIRRVADTIDADFKFTKNAVLKAGLSITIWSNAAVNGKNDPPTDYLAKHPWPVGDNMITVLLDKDSAEQSRRESQKEVAQITTEKRQRTSTTATVEVHTMNGNGEPEAQPQKSTFRFLGSLFSKS